MCKMSGIPSRVGFDLDDNSPRTGRYPQLLPRWYTGSLAQIARQHNPIRSVQSYGCICRDVQITVGETSSWEWEH
jgi:hypothetical protein